MDVMPPARHLPIWHVIAAILQIAALLALAMAAPAHASAHAHADTHVDAGHASGERAHRQIAHAPGDAGAALLSADADREPAAGPCCPGCCCGSCHPFAAGPADSALPFRRPAARAVRPPPEAAYAGVTPEALPEPPRPFA